MHRQIVQYIWCRHWQKASVGKSDQIVIHVHFHGLPTSSSDGVVTHVDLVCLEDCSHRSTGCALPNACAPVRAISSSHNFIGHCNTSGLRLGYTSTRVPSSPLLRQDSSSTAPDNCIEPRSIVSRFMTESSKNRSYTRPCTVPSLSVVSS